MHIETARLLPGMDMAFTKVEASPDLVLTALSASAHGTPRDIAQAIRTGAPLPADGRLLGRRAILYKLERDSWTTVLREGDRFASYDAILARKLSRVLGTRAIAVFADGPRTNLAVDVYSKGEHVVEALVADEEREARGGCSELLERDPAAYMRAVLAQQSCTNDRLGFRQFELPGVILGRWDIALERAILVPELMEVTDERPKTRRFSRVEIASEKKLSREGERALQNLLGGLIEETTRSL